MKCPIIKTRSAGAVYDKCWVLEPQTVFFSSQGATVWIPDPDAVWVSAVLLQAFTPGGKQLRLQLSDGKVRGVKSQSEH